MKNSWLKSMFLLGALPIGAVASAAAGESQTACENSQPNAVAGTATVAVAGVPASAAESLCYSYLGVAVETMGDAARRENPRPGLRVIYVLENSPAARAGILKGDILTSIDGQKLFFPNQFCSLVRSYEPGSKIRISLLRNDETVELPATVGERRIATVPAVPIVPRKLARDDVRIYINGREISFADGEGFEHVVLTPNGILIRDDEEDFSTEVRRLISRVHAKLPDSKKMLTSLRKQYDEARAAVVGKTQHTFSQVFFGSGNSVIIVGNEKGRQVTVSREGDDNVLFRGNCTTQADIDAIPKEAKEIIDSFTVLKPVPVPTENVPENAAEKTDVPAEEKGAEKDSVPAS